ncbi:MAG: helix-turn-helix domain-containing protein [Sphingomonas fennica]
MQTFSTAALPSTGKIAAWNALYASHLAQVDFQPADRREFRAELTTGELGPISVARMRADRSSIDRTPSHIRHASRRLYTFVLQEKGRGLFSHCGHEAVLQEGDFALCDSAAPHKLAVEDRSEIIMLRVPASVMRSYFPTPEEYCGRRLPAARGLAQTAGAMARTLCRQVETGLGSDHGACAARHLMNMMASTYALGFDPALGSAPTAVIAARYTEVKRYIEDRLRETDLIPASIAAGLRISARYVRMVFSAHDETVSAYILRRRLEEIARQLRDPRWHGHTITEIAFSWGFNSAPHFARSFRERYGVTARDYRRGAGEPEAA